MDKSTQSTEPRFLDFDETELAHLEEFQKTTLDERVDWLWHMLEVFQAAEEFQREQAKAKSP